MEMKEIINCAAYSQGRRVADVKLDRVHEMLRETNQFVWTGLHEPSEDILTQVQKEFGLHDLAVWWGWKCIGSHLPTVVEFNKWSHLQ